MKEKNATQVYFIGSRFGGTESVLVDDRECKSVIAYPSFEKTKDRFKSVYEDLLAPSFTPSNPWTEEETQYHAQMFGLVRFYPVIVELNMENASDVLLEWRDEAYPTFQTDEQFLTGNIWHCPMRSGFLAKYGVLDIVKDIENTPFVGPDGKMVLRINSIRYHGTNEKQRKYKPLSKEEIDAILRLRGFL